MADYPDHMEECKWMQDTISTAECILDVCPLTSD
jgi:hypothetical protein